MSSFRRIGELLKGDDGMGFELVFPALEALSREIAVYAPYARLAECGDLLEYGIGRFRGRIVGIDQHGQAWIPRHQPGTIS